MKKVIIITIIVLLALSTRCLAWEKTDTFIQNGKELKFKFDKPDTSILTHLTYPNGNRVPLVKGAYVMHYVDMFMNKNSSIFLVLDSNVGSYVMVYNGVSFFKHMDFDGLVTDAVYRAEEDAHVVYGLLENGGHDEFRGLLEYRNGLWHFRESKGDKKLGPDQILLDSGELMIVHNEWDGGNPEVTYFDPRHNIFYTKE